ncbi:unnamed protein product [Miscanthus lutarioriparius]|uniref:Uncharacterized protein n=1 Tax=Miscanthus lutarioriparius TaxID=422564 RepID=A0A811N839_9POAL|nr:unnamed protein product [Miscanthus lutarioriparius]
MVGGTKQPVRGSAGLWAAAVILSPFSALAALVHCTVCAGPVPSSVTTNIRAAQWRVLATSDPSAAKPHSSKLSLLVLCFSIFLASQHSVGRRSMAGVREEEFDEGDVWDVLQDDNRPAAALMATTTPPRIRRGSNKSKKVVASSKDESVAAGGAGAGARGRGRSSAPVAIPAGSSSSARRRGGNSEEDEEEEDDGGEMLPPHEWLARKMERMGVASPPDQACRPGRSKGRELTKVRDAVLPKTAFSER